MLTTIDHVGVAVEDVDAALALYRDALGMALVHRETVPSRAWTRRCSTSATGTSSCSSRSGRRRPWASILARKGPGLHHVAYRVADIDAALSALAEAGLRLIDERPRVGIRNSRVAFIHPASTGGVLTEIVQPAEGH